MRRISIDLRNASNLSDAVTASNFFEVHELDDINASDGVYSPGDTAGNQTEVDRLIWTYCSPPIFLLGIVGNALTVLVTSQPPTRNTSSGVYLLGMSVAAIGVYLVGFLAQWLRSCGFIDVTETNPWSCRVNKYLYYSFGDVAIWLLTLLTIDRLVAICFPLKKMHICSRRRAITLCWIVTFLALSKNLHIFWTRGTEYLKSGELRSNCGATEGFADFEKYVRPWIVFTLVTVLPVCIILFCNVLVIRVLMRGRKVRSTGKKRHATRMTTMMCLVASFTFILFMAPSIILVVLHPYYPSSTSYKIAKAVNNLLVHVNYAANFFLYCLGGRSFRTRLRILLLSIFCGARRARLELQPFFGYAQRTQAPTEITMMSSGSSSGTFHQINSVSNSFKI